MGRNVSGILHEAWAGMIFEHNWVPILLKQHEYKMMCVAFAQQRGNDIFDRVDKTQKKGRRRNCKSPNGTGHVEGRRAHDAAKKKKKAANPV